MTRFLLKVLPPQVVDRVQKLQDELETLKSCVAQLHEPPVVHKGSYTGYPVILHVVKVGGYTN